jgi:hypothetical protein
LLEFVDGLKIGYSTRCRRFLGGGRDELVHSQDEWTTHKHFHEWERIDELVGELPRPPNRKHAHLYWVLARLHPALRRNVAVPKTAAEVTFNLYEISLWHSEGLEQAQLPPDLWYPQRATRDYPGAHLIEHSISPFAVAHVIRLNHGILSGYMHFHYALSSTMQELAATAMSKAGFTRDEITNLYSHFYENGSAFFDCAPKQSLMRVAMTLLWDREVGIALFGDASLLGARECGVNRSKFMARLRLAYEHRHAWFLALALTNVFRADEWSRASESRSVFDRVYAISPIFSQEFVSISLGPSIDSDDICRTFAQAYEEIDLAERTRSAVISDFNNPYSPEDASLARLLDNVPQTLLRESIISSLEKPTDFRTFAL